MNKNNWMNKNDWINSMQQRHSSTPETPPKTLKRQKSAASPAAKRRRAEDRINANPFVEELAEVDRRLHAKWSSPGGRIVLPLVEPDLPPEQEVFPVERLEDANFAEDPIDANPGPVVIRVVEGFPVAGAVALGEDAPAPAAAAPASPPPSFPAAGPPAVWEEDDDASALASSVRAPSTRGLLRIRQWPDAPSPMSPSIPSSDEDDGP